VDASLFEAADFHGKIMGKSWEYGGLMGMNGIFMRFYGDLMVN